MQQQRMMMPTTTATRGRSSRQPITSTALAPLLLPLLRQPLVRPGYPRGERRPPWCSSRRRGVVLCLEAPAPVAAAVVETETTAAAQTETTAETETETETETAAAVETETVVETETAAEVVADANVTGTLAIDRIDILRLI